jgi:hypothetical protein
VDSVDAFTVSQPRPGKAASAANAADRPINSLRLIFRLLPQLADYPRNDSLMRAGSLHRIGSSLQLIDYWPGERTIIAPMPTEPLGSKAAWWIWNLSIWVGISLIDATQNVVVMHSEGMHHAWVALFFVLLVARLPWALFTPVILRLARRYPPTQFTRPITMGPHVIAGLIMGLVVAAWVAGWEKLLNPWAYSSDAGPLLDLWKGRFYNGLLETFFFMPPFSPPTRSSNPEIASYEKQPRKPN